MKDFLKGRKLINWLGLLGVVSFLSYLAAVIFSPLAYPGYDWLSQAVSDLSADNAPSLKLWNSLSALYGANGLIAMVLACLLLSEKRYNKCLSAGIYVFTVMNFVSSIGYTMFPLTEAGNVMNFQNIMHVYVVTVLVVVLSIVGLSLCIVGGLKKRGDRLLGIGATICLSLMMVGAIASNLVPKEVFGLFERFSTLSATLYVAIVGVFVFKSESVKKEEVPSTIKPVEKE